MVDVTTAALLIPFRDRGKDPLRVANLERVVKQCEGIADWLRAYHDVTVTVIDDGRCGDDHFNRSMAYNRGAESTNADILAYVEADILISEPQIRDAIQMASTQTGLVIPFTRQLKLTEDASALVRAGMMLPGPHLPTDPHPYGEDSNNGCVNVISRQTLAMVGQWDETFEGHGHDDTSMYISFAKCAGPARWIKGPAYHLYHLDVDPDTAPDKSHLSADDIAAQKANLDRLNLYRKARTPDEIRALTSGRSRREWHTRWIRENDPRAGRYLA